MLLASIPFFYRLHRKISVALFSVLRQNIDVDQRLVVIFDIRQAYNGIARDYPKHFFAVLHKVLVKLIGFLFNDITDIGCTSSIISILILSFIMQSSNF